VDTLLQSLAATVAVLMIWMDLLRDLWRPAMSLSEEGTEKDGMSAKGERRATSHAAGYGAALLLLILAGHNAVRRN
jgi:hypothetical protein